MTCKTGGFPAVAKEDQIEEGKIAGLTEQEEADKLGVTLGRFQAMKAYASQLAKSDKRMKTSTIRRKVCEKFNVKLT